MRCFLSLLVQACGSVEYGATGGGTSLRARLSGGTASAGHYADPSGQLAATDGAPARPMDDQDPLRRLLPKADRGGDRRLGTMRPWRVRACELASELID